MSTAEFFIGSREDGKDGVVCTKVRLPERFQRVATNSFETGDLMVQFLGASGAVTFVDDPAPA